MNALKKWIKAYPDLWEFVLFNLLSNCATITNFVVMWVCTGFVFSSLRDRSFQFFVFHYTDTAADLGLCGFLSFLTATAAAQTVNFFVQKNLVFKSDARFSRAVPQYIVLAVVLVIVSAALPAYSQTLFIRIGIPQGLAPTLANIVNIVVQVVLNYPTMKFIIMRKK